MFFASAYAFSFLLILQNVTRLHGQDTCRYADLFTIDDLVQNRDNAIHRFKMEMCKWEGKFGFGVGYNKLTGITYDGQKIDYETGVIRDDLLNYWTASSKEALHVNMLTLYLLDDVYARQFFGNASQSNVLDVLEKKIASYNDFHRRYPGFGGFLPWLAANGTEMNLYKDWKSRVPSLDNGQLIWSIKILIEALRRKSLVDLAAKYQERLDLMTKTVIPVFYDAVRGGIRCETSIINLLDEEEMTNPNNYATNGQCLLEDPYEGELMAFFMDLYAPWEQYNFTMEEREKIWIKKRSWLVRVEYNTTTPSNSIDQERVTIQQGFWFSSHEQWKYFYLPYQDVELQRRLFVNGEKVRVYHSAANGIPGLYASVSNTSPVGTYIIDYHNACGVQAAASQVIQYHDLVTPYASFPVIMANESVGLAWYLHMLKGSAMQNLYGSTEAIHVDGLTISPLITWDSKITTVVAMLSSNLIDVTRQILKNDGTYDRFYNVTDREWSRVFGSKELLGEDIPWYLPTVSLPRPSNGLSDFTQCRNDGSDSFGINRPRVITILVFIIIFCALALTF